MADSSRHKQQGLLLFPGCIFLMAFNVMAFEVAVSRLLAVLLSYHYVFLVLSMALLGLGLGGMLSWVLRKETPSDETKPLVLGRRALIFSVAVPACIFLAIQAGQFVDPTWTIVLISLIVCTPFIAAGLFMAEMYRSFPEATHRLYGMDLMGAGAGAWGAVWMLDCVGGVRVHFLIGAGAALVAFILAFRQGRAGRRLWGLSLCAMALCLILAAGVFHDRLFQVPIGRNPEKEIHDALNSFQGEVAESRWTAFGRTDLVRYRLRPDMMDLYVDGTAGSPMYRFRGDLDDLGHIVEKELSDFPGSFPFRFLKPGARRSALIIGPGGGRDVLLCLWGGLERITAVEINADLVDVVRRHAGFNSGIYEGFPKVDVRVDEGRRFLRRQTEPYDLIFLSLPVINTTRSVEGYALTENFLFTLESMGEYWAHLTGEGSLAVVGHNDAEILRLLVLTLNLMGKQGLGPAEAMQHVYMVASDEYLCFVLRKTAFTPTETREMHRAMVMQGFQPAASFFPFVPAANSSLRALSLGRIGLDDLIRQVQERGWDIRTVTDNRPFFYQLEAGTPRPVLVVLGAALALYVVIVWAPWAVVGKSRRGKSANTLLSGESSGILFYAAGLFSLLGAGFMLAELSLLARFYLFFSSPAIAMAACLSSLLGWVGFGSWVSRRWHPQAPERRIRAACLALIPGILLYAALLPWAVSRLVSLNDGWRLIACVLLLMPVGVVAGVPFPSAVQWLKNLGMQNVIPWMYGINGVSSVVGSALSLLLATSFGFQQALLASAACYLFLYFLMRTACEQGSAELKAKSGVMAVT